MSEKPNNSGGLLSRLKNRPGPIKVWNNVLRNYLIRNNSMRGPVRDHLFYAGSNATYSGRDRVTYYYTIDKYPRQIPITLRTNLRNQVKGSVRVSFITPMEPTTIAWDSAKMKSRVGTWQRTAREEESKEQNEFNYRENMTAQGTLAQRKDSLVYLADAETARKRRMFISRTIMVITGYRGEEFDVSVEDIQKYCNSIELGITRVNNDIESYIRAFSPFTNEMDNEVKKNVGNTTLPDEKIARFSTYDQGRVGTGNFYIGTDIHSNFHVFKQFKRTEVDAENILISAETGGGKSFVTKSIILQLLAEGHYNGTIMDIEGDEYIPIANVVSNSINVVVINMAEGQGSYFDPMPIIRTGNPELDSDMYALSFGCADSILTALVGNVGEFQQLARNIIKHLVSNAYRRAGVISNDHSTWSKSANLSIHSVMKEVSIIDKLLESPPNGREPRIISTIRTNELYKNAYDMVTEALDRYLGDTSESKVFRNKIVLHDIVDANLVICSFGMRGRSPSSVDPVQMALSQIYAAHISHLRSMFSKNSNKFNFKVWEEFQRWGKFPGSEDTINTTLTGGRKLGDVNIIVTNKLSELLGEDKFGVFENITSFIVGAIGNQKTREAFCKSQAVEKYYDEFSKIVIPKKKKSSFDLEGSGDENEETFEDIIGGSNYNKAFLVSLDRSEVAMVKVQMHPALGSSDLFKTGVNVSGKIASFGDSLSSTFSVSE